MKKKPRKGKKVKQLIKLASQARRKAYAPYSKFKVGAAIEASNGKIYTGCNVENASYGVAVCAERTALVKAISEGAKKFKRIAIVAATKGPCSPCGICRQALYEFSPNIEIIMSNTKGRLYTESLPSLLKHPFKSNKK